MNFHFVAVVVLLGVCLGAVGGHPERPPLMDTSKASELFRLIEGNSSRADGTLDRGEVEQLFEEFDVDGDKRILPEEFAAVWTKKGMGVVTRANLMFRRLDSNGDGVITRFPDVHRAFHYFDMNADGVISEIEYVIIWNSMST